MKKYPKERLQDKKNIDQPEKPMSKPIANNGYGYMKRRYGLLSNETDRIKDESAPKKEQP